MKTSTFKFKNINLKENNGWYDFTLTIKGNDYFRRSFANHIKTGEASITDSVMGRI